MKEATLKQGLQFLGEFERQFGDKPIPRENFQSALDTGLLADFIKAIKLGSLGEADREDFQKVLGLPKWRSFVLHVNCDLSVEQMVKMGKYDFVNENIIGETDGEPNGEPNFTILGTGQEDIKTILFRPNKVVTSEKVVEMMQNDGLKPANLASLLTFGFSKETKDIQREYPVICLDPVSVWRDPHGSLCVPVLWGLSDDRDLSLLWLENAWYPLYRFLAVCE